MSERESMQYCDKNGVLKKKCVRRVVRSVK